MDAPMTFDLPWLLLCGCLTGCAAQNSDLALKMLGNLERCERHYTLGLGAGASGSLVIHCAPIEASPSTVPK